MGTTIVVGVIVLFLIVVVLGIIVVARGLNRGDALLPPPAGPSTWTSGPTPDAGAPLAPPPQTPQVTRAPEAPLVQPTPRGTDALDLAALDARLAPNALPDAQPGPEPLAEGGGAEPPAQPGSGTPVDDGLGDRP